MKLWILHCWIALTFVDFSYADVFDPWLAYTKVTEVRFGKDPFSDDCKLAVKLLEPLASLGDGTAGAEIGDKTITLYHCELGDHGFVYTSEGELYVDNLFVGRFVKTDDIRYGFGRFWANGKPCGLAPLTKNQKEMLFSDWEVRGVVNQVEQEPWKVFVTPRGLWGGGSGHHTIENGMTVLRFDKGMLHLHGVSYGPVAKGDEIRVVDGTVSINGQLRFPAQRIKQNESKAGPRE